MNLPLRSLGQSDLAITPVGIGTAPIGSSAAWRIYWGHQDEHEAIRAIQAALDRGINWIDTAPFYGWGRAEALVGQAVAGRRAKVLLFTKCGTLPDSQGGWVECLTPASIRQEVDESLRRLGTDYLDLLQLHDPDPHTPIEESWMEVRRLIDSGKVRYAGLSNHPVELMDRARAIAPITAIQHQYNLLQRSVEQDVLPYAQQHGIGCLAWAPLASGFLADGFDLEALDPQDFRRRHPFAQPPLAARVAELRSVLQQAAAEQRRTMVDLALAWVLGRPEITGAIVGIRNVQEAIALADGVAWRLSEAAAISGSM